jgi:hypothetical protein
MTPAHDVKLLEPYRGDPTPVEPRCLGARIMSVYRRGLAFFLISGLLGPTSLAGQGYRGELRIRAEVIELAGLRRDSLLESSVPGDGLRRLLADGTVATCVPGGFCRWYGSGEVNTVSPTYGDFRFTAWPGFEGLSVHGQIRTRLLSDDLWPRTDQELDLITGYLRYEGGDWRASAGRQFRTGSLGYHNFDGASVRWKGLDALGLEAWGGWSLYPGTNAPRDGDLLADADVFAPEKRSFIYGFEADLDVRRTFFLNGLYQREIRTDRLALYSERIGADARLMLGTLVMDGSLAYDLVNEELNSARLRASVPLPTGLHLTVEGRHYTPFFELWTIWGAFSPVGYNEGRGTLRWRVPGTAVRLEAGGAYRDYEAADAGADFVEMKDDGWRVFGGGQWQGPAWFVDGGYRAETGFGAARYGGDLTVGRTIGSSARLALHGTATETFGEFRVGERLVSGGGLDGSFTVGDFTLEGSAGLYRITFDNRPRNDNWTQMRAHLSLAYRFGSTPTPRTSMRGIGGY